MDSSTQHNAALVEEAAAAATALSEQADKLAEVVSLFHLDTQSMSAPVASRPAPAPARPLVAAPARANVVPLVRPGTAPKVPAINDEWETF
jgi:methyl-accepting chemotaxis protein